MARSSHRSLTVIPTRRLLRLVRDGQSEPVESDYWLQTIIARWPTLSVRQQQLLWAFSGGSPEAAPGRVTRDERFLLFIRRVGQAAS